MPIDVMCPECEKKLRLRDDVAGKRVKCPKCGNKFVAAASADEADEDNETIAMQEEHPAKAKKPSKRRRRDDDDDDDDAPRKRKRPREVDQVATPLGPLIWGVLAILMPCPVGGAAALLAMGKASVELGNLPAGRKGDSARRNMKIAMALGGVGLITSLIASVVLFTVKWQ